MTDTYESAIYADVHGALPEARRTWGTSTLTTMGTPYWTSWQDPRPRWTSARSTNDYIMFRSDKRWWRRSRSSSRTCLRGGWSNRGVARV